MSRRCRHVGAHQSRSCTTCATSLGRGSRRRTRRARWRSLARPRAATPTRRSARRSLSFEATLVVAVVGQRLGDAAWWPGLKAALGVEVDPAGVFLTSSIARGVAGERSRPSHRRVKPMSGSTPMENRTQCPVGSARRCGRLIHSNEASPRTRNALWLYRRVKAQTLADRDRLWSIRCPW